MITEGVLDPADRGLLYGDGLFETIAIADGDPVLWNLHYARLSAGAQRLGLPVPVSEVLLRDLRRAADGTTKGVGKIVLTRGCGGRGYRPPSHAEPAVFISTHPWPEYPAHWPGEGVMIRWCDTPVSQNPVLAGMKHLCRLENVLARAEWDDPEIAEGLMLCPRGHVIEGTSSNLFVVRDGQLMTPQLNAAGVAGVMRQWIIERFAGWGQPVATACLDRDAVESADEVFLCNSVIGIWPVMRLGDRDLKVGATVRRIQAALAELGGGIWAR